MQGSCYFLFAGRELFVEVDYFLVQTRLTFAEKQNCSDYRERDECIKNCKAFWKALCCGAGKRCWVPLWSKSRQNSDLSFVVDVLVKFVYNVAVKFNRAINKRECCFAGMAHELFSEKDIAGFCSAKNKMGHVGKVCFNR